MDALPIAETTGLPHASTVPGVMHACGHDGHTASLLGAAALLRQDVTWNGTIQLVFQPAEEDGSGAREMIADGLSSGFRWGDSLATTTGQVWRSARLACTTARRWRKAGA